MALEIGPVKGLDGLGGSFRLHLHETETPRAAGLPVGNQADAGNFTMLAEEALHIVLGSGQGKVSQINGFHTCSRCWEIIGLSNPTKSKMGALASADHPAGFDIPSW